MHFQTWLSIFHFIKCLSKFPRPPSFSSHHLQTTNITIIIRIMAREWWRSKSWSGPAACSCRPFLLRPALPAASNTRLTKVTNLINLSTQCHHHRHHHRHRHHHCHRHCYHQDYTTNEAQAVILFNPTSGGVLFPCVFFGIGNAKTLPILTNFWLFCRKFTHFLVYFNRLRLCTQTN